MRAFLIGLICLFFWTVLARYIYVCKIKNHCQPTAAVVESNRLMNLQLIDGDTPLLEGYEQFEFDNSSIVPNLSANNERYLNGLTAFLNNNPERNLTIKGLYRPSEAGIQEGMYENLGVARANAIKEILMERGIAKDRLFLDYDTGSEELREPVNFSLNDTPEGYENTDGRLINAQYSFDNMTFSDANFESSSAIFTPSQAFLNWADSVQVFLAANPETDLTIIGHTDKTGSDGYNKGLGLERAKAAKEFFESQDVSATIKVASKGEKQPIATNKTKLGRQKNRRVNFILK